MNCYCYCVNNLAIMCLNFREVISIPILIRSCWLVWTGFVRFKCVCIHWVAMTYLIACWVSHVNVLNIIVLDYDEMHMYGTYVIDYVCMFGVILQGWYGLEMRICSWRFWSRHGIKTWVKEHVMAHKHFFFFETHQWS